MRGGGARQVNGLNNNSMSVKLRGGGEKCWAFSYCFVFQSKGPWPSVTHCDELFGVTNIQKPNSKIYGNICPISRKNRTHVKIQVGKSGEKAHTTKIRRQLTRASVIYVY